jgi:hypothetical protein
MGRITPLYPKTDNPLLFMKQVVQQHEAEDNADAVVVAIKLKTGEWALGYCNAGFDRRLEAMAQINVDVIDMMILNNPERYGLHEHD